MFIKQKWLSFKTELIKAGYSGQSPYAQQQAYHQPYAPQQPYNPQQPYQQPGMLQISFVFSCKINFLYSLKKLILNPLIILFIL